MQAIVTRYLGPTNTRGARIKAKALSGSRTVPYDHALGAFENHHAAAKALCAKLGDGIERRHTLWKSRAACLQGGEMPNGRGYVFL